MDGPVSARGSDDLPCLIGYEERIYYGEGRYNLRFAKVDAFSWWVDSRSLQFMLREDCWIRR